MSRTKNGEVCATVAQNPEKVTRGKPNQLWWIVSKGCETSWEAAEMRIEDGYLILLDDTGRCTAAFAPGGWMFVLEDKISPPEEELAPEGRALQ